MRNDNYLSLINFKVKSSSSEPFLDEHDVGCSIFLKQRKN